MKVAFINSSNLPVPATLGGAVENMLTHFIDENEEQKRLEVTVFEQYEPEAERLSHKYKQTKCVFFKSGLFDMVYYYAYRILNRLTLRKKYNYGRTEFIRWCSRHINKSDYDYVVVEGGWWQVQHLSTAISNKIILHIHYDALNDTLSYSKPVMEACHKIIAVSDFCKRRIEKVHVENKGSDFVQVLRNVIDIHHFCDTGMEQSRKKIMEKYNIPPGKIIITYCGRLQPFKGVLQLIRAVVAMKNPQVFLMIIGASYFKNSMNTEYTEQVEREIKNVKGGYVMTGYVSQDELPDYIRASYLQVVPSIYNEVAGNVIIEALACGTPVVASNRGGIPEYADEKACILVEHDDKFVDSLSNAIARMISDPALYDEKKRHARRVALQYGKKAYYDNFISLLNS